MGRAKRLFNDFTKEQLQRERIHVAPTGVIVMVAMYSVPPPNIPFGFVFKEDLAGNVL